MAEVLERLVAVLEADIRNFDKNTAAAAKMFDQRANQITRSQERMMGRLNTGFERGNRGLNNLINRYASWGAAVSVLRQIVSRAIDTNDEAAASWQRVDEALNHLAGTSAPIVSAFFVEMAARIETTNRELEALIGLWEGLKRVVAGAPTLPNSILMPGHDLNNTFNSKTRDWTPHPQGFPVPGVTDVTPAKPKLAGKADEPINLTASLDMIDTLHKLEEQTWDTIKAQQAFVSEQYLIGQATRNEAAAGVREATEELAELAKESAKLEAERVAERISEIGDGFEYLAAAALEGGDAFERALADMARSLAVSGLRNIFEGILGGLSGGGGFIGNMISGTRAAGGPVQSGQTYLVGEKGPELFRAGSSGTIIPHAAARSSGGPITLHMPIDARGAQAGVAEQIAKVAPAIVAAAVSQVNRNFGSMMIKTQRDQL